MKHHENGQPTRIEKYLHGRLISCQEINDEGKTIAATKFV